MKTKYVCAFGRFAASLVGSAGAPTMRRLVFMPVLLLALSSSARAQIVTRVASGDTIAVAGMGTAY